MKRLLPMMMVLVASCGAPAVSKPAASPTASATLTPIASASTTALPLGRWAAAMAYDESRHNLLLFGGLADQTLLDDTWTWDGTTWSPRQGLTASPQARQAASIAYDPASRQVILFGGLAASGQQNDTWAWNGAAWLLLHPAHAPSPREGAPMLYDPAADSVILYGGMNDSGARPGPINDTWSWNGTDWTPLHPSQSPAGGTRPRMAFLAGLNLLERFGDCPKSHDNSLYSFDGHTWSAHSATGTWPPALCLPSLAGDPSRHQLLLFGGNPATSATPVPAETWTYDGSTWSKRSPTQSPAARDDAPMVYDPELHALVLFGGQGLNQGQAGPLNDTWTWDGTTWTAH